MLLPPEHRHRVNLQGRHASQAARFHGRGPLGRRGGFTNPPLLVPDGEHEIQRRGFTNVLDAVLVVRGHVGGPARPYTLGLARDGDFEHAVADQEHLFVRVVMGRVG